jgi:anthranilate synthase component 2
MKIRQPKILVIDNYDSFTYNLIQMLEEHAGCSFDVVRNDQLPVQSMDKYRKILISPGPGLPSQIDLVCELIKKYAESISILGVCLGHQAIAEVYGGSLLNLPIVSHGISKRIQVIDPLEYLFQGVPENFDAGLYHSWVVNKDTMPDCLRITAVSDDGLVMAQAHNQYDVRGIQFHPESIMTGAGKTIIGNWIDHENKLK